MKKALTTRCTTPGHHAGNTSGPAETMNSRTSTGSSLRTSSGPGPCSAACAAPHNATRATPRWAAATLSLACLAATGQTVSSSGPSPAATAETTQAVTFRTVDGLPVGEAVGSLPPSATRGLFNQSRGLPLGSRLLLSLERGQAPADGRTPVRLRVEAFDAQGQRIPGPYRLLLETTLGRLQVPNRSGRGKAVVELAAVEAEVRGGIVELPLMAPDLPVSARLGASAGAVGVEGELEFLPDLRPLFAVGLVEGALHTGKVTQSAQSPVLQERGFEKLLRSWNNRNGESEGDANLTGRAALYAKGAIKGDMLLTLAADTEATRDKLFRDIDPNAYYPVVGDASVRTQDAQSRQRLFVRIDKGRSFALLGHYATGSTNPAYKLANYQRALSGAQWVYEGQTVRVSAFAAQQTTRAFVDEQPGRGISGPYAVAQANALANSERVEIVVRSAAQADVVLRRTRMQRYVDYDFEPFSGRILFNAPVPSIDESGNPVSIRVMYEADGAAARHWVAGGEVQAQVTERLTLGASAAKDDTPGAPYQLMGANATYRLGANTWVVVEAAQSQGTQRVNQALPPVGGADPAQLKGSAARIELQHQSADTLVRAQVAKTGAGFQNPTSELSGGRVEANVQASRKLNNTVELRAGAVRTQDNSGSASDGAGRTAASVGAGVALTPKVRVDVAVNRVAQDPLAGSSGVTAVPPPTSLGGIGFGVAPGGSLASPVNTLGLTNSGLPAPTTQAQAGADYTSLGARVTGQVTPSSAVYAEAERTTDGRGRAGVGGETRLDERTRAYARHEFSNSITGPYGLNTDGLNRRTTALGVDTAVLGDGTVFAEYRIAGSVAGADAARAVGLRKGWQLAPGLNSQTSFERQNISLASGARESATAVSLGLNYLAPQQWKAMGRVDWRLGTYQRELLNILALDRQINNRWTALIRNYARTSEGRAGNGGVPGSGGLGKTLQDRFQLGAAYRSVDGGRWDGLGRVEYRIDQTEGSTGGLLNQDTRSLIASLHANTRFNRSLTLSGQVAGKAVDERVALGGLPAAGSWNGSLLAGRVIWDFADRYDLSAFGSWQHNASTTARGLGMELGYRVVDNLWVSGAWNHGQYSDVDLFSANTSWNGLTVRLRWKFDERTLSAGDPRLNRAMDEAGEGLSRLMRLWRE